MLFIPPIIGSFYHFISNDSILFVPPISIETHGLILLKSTIVGVSWVFAFFPLKHLLITIITPIIATGPIWTLICALFIYHETYNTWQWLEIIIVILFFYYFSLAGNREGFNLKRNKWLLVILLVATFLEGFSTSI